MLWDEIATTQLELMYREGLSAKVIGDKMGCSRNAIVGKIHRMGLQVRAYEEGWRKPPAKPGGRKPGITGPVRVRTKKYKPYTPKVLPDPSIEMRKLSLMELTDDTCRWPVGEPGAWDFFFCGNPVLVDGRPYCAHHTRWAYSRRDEEEADDVSS